MSNYPETRARILVAATRPVPRSTVRELWNPKLDVEGVTSWAGRKAGIPCTRGSTVVKSASAPYAEDFYETYLACADFVKRNERKCLCEHGAGEVFLRQQQRHRDQGEQDLRDECHRLNTEACVRGLLRAEM